MTIELEEKEACCLNCRFWQQSTAIVFGICRRYPPKFWSEGEESGSAQVGTSSYDWCGEHKFEESEGWFLPKVFKIIDSKGNEVGET